MQELTCASPSSSLQALHCEAVCEARECQGMSLQGGGFIGVLALRFDVLLHYKSLGFCVTMGVHVCSLDFRDRTSACLTWLMPSPIT